LIEFDAEGDSKFRGNEKSYPTPARMMFIAAQQRADFVFNGDGWRPRRR